MVARFLIAIILLVPASNFLYCQCPTIPFWIVNEDTSDLYETFTSIAHRNDTFCFVGSSSNLSLVMFTDTCGAQYLTKLIALGNNYSGFQKVIDYNGTFIIAGACKGCGVDTFLHGSIIKINNNGDILDSAFAGSGNTDHGLTSIVADGSFLVGCGVAGGGLNLSGWLVKFDQDLNTINESTFPAPAYGIIFTGIASDIFHNYYISATGVDSVTQTFYYYVLKTDSNFNQLWLYTSPNYDLSGIVVADDGSVFAVGDTAETNYEIDAYVLKLDGANGNLIKSKSFYPGDSFSQTGRDIKLLSDGTLLIGANDCTSCDTGYSCQGLVLHLTEDLNEIESWRSTSLHHAHNIQAVEAVSDNPLRFGYGGVLSYTSDFSFNLLYGLSSSCSTGIDELNLILSIKIFPNPLTSSSTIQFTLPQPSNARIEIFDVYGNVVFKHESRQSSGVHQLQFDASYLPSGVYFCDLIVDNQKSEGKMVIMK